MICDLEINEYITNELFKTKQVKTISTRGSRY